MRSRYLIVCLTATLAIGPLSAQADPESPSDGGNGLRIYVGMWTTHIRRLGTGMENNWLVGLGWRGMFGATFINSYGDRAFTIGLQHSLARGSDGVMDRGVGYRLGLITGYDGRLMSLAEKTPVLPMAQLVGDVGMGPAGVEFAWAGLIATMAPAVRF
jgi:hypothetical protein